VLFRPLRWQADRSVTVASLTGVAVL